jgi:hypothetical protein
MLNKIPVKVPPEIKYLSEWDGYTIPRGKCIVDKKVCGCGYTQLCLMNNDNVILCSPRKSLLENKLEQNPQCFYFTPISLSIGERKKLNLFNDADYTKYIFNLQKENLKSYCSERIENNLPLKILVTYDSLPKLIEVLSFILMKDLFESFVIIVDEFQLVFSDARFKANVELDFVEYLDKYCKNVVYLSGTPMLESYLEALPFFKDLDYYELIWDQKRISSINILRIKTDNLEKSAIEIVNLYKQGKGPVKIVDGKEVRSEEAVLFVNNISMITEIIKGAKLKPDDVNIITARTSLNYSKIKKCGKGFNFGRIPIKGEKNKLITLCSSTAYCGVDMYSDSAKTYVFSDCNIKTMTVDISIELPQIVGRQRLDSNPFRNDITFFCISSINDFSDGDFKKEVFLKKKRTEHQMEVFDILKSQNQNELLDSHRNDMRDWITWNNYKDSYTSISRDSGELVLNELMVLADIRCWQLQKRIYANDVTVVKLLNSVGNLGSITGISSMLEKSASYPLFEDRLKLMAAYIHDNPDEIGYLPKEYRDFIENFSYGELSSCGFRKDALSLKLELKLKKKGLESNQSFRDLLYESFEVGEVYTFKLIKETLIDLMDKSNIGLKAKANLLEDYFNVKTVRVKNLETGKRDAGYRIISIKN